MDDQRGGSSEKEPDDEPGRADDGDDESGPGDDASLSPPLIPYASPGMRAESEAFARLKTLRRLPQFEAGLAAAKLEAAGVPSFIADQNISVAHPLLFGEVRLQVAEADLERAEQILSTPSAPVMPDDDDDDDDDEDVDHDAADDGYGARREQHENAADDDDYVEEAYRCPRCRRKAVDLTPLSPAMRNTRFGCLLVLFMPIIVVLVSWMMPGTQRDAGGGGDIPTPVGIGWLLLLGVLSFIVLTAKRGKRCRECGHEWVKAGE